MDDFKEPLIWFVILMAGLRIISPRPRHFEQACSIVSGLLFSFPEKFAQGLIRLCWRDVCCTYVWHLQCLWNCRLWLALFTVLRLGKDGRYGFEISRKHRRLAFVFILLIRLIWLCKTAKLNKSAFSNFKRMTYCQPYLHWCMEANHTLRNAFSSDLDFPKMKSFSMVG